MGKEKTTMGSKTSTLIHAIGVIIVFSTFMAIFAGIAIALMVVGIFWAFQLFFTVGWWATSLVFIALLAAYATALSFGLALLERKEDA